VVLTQEGHVWTWGQPWPPGDMYGDTRQIINLFCYFLLEFVADHTTFSASKYLHQYVCKAFRK
jgi:hypothetical protein